jgi:hypothetical protein
MTGLPLLSTGTVASGAASARRSLAGPLEAITYTRVAVPAPELTKVSWESGAAISPGTPEHCVQSFFDALVADKEDAMLGCFGTGDEFASARHDALAIVQLYKYRKQAGAKIDSKLVSSRLAQSEFAVVDSEMLISQLGETNLMKYAFVCKLFDDGWKIYSCGATDAAEQICKSHVQLIDSKIKISLLTGKGFPASVAALYEGTEGGSEPKCPFSGGLSYILEQDPERRLYAIHCPCVGLFPSHVRPVEPDAIGKILQ